ncbi:MAG: amidohydrolase family protein [Candidatus Sumerlaeota bacterium]|nr:amidohydrolase family protein [Candidatus Sumerlaeota bacterium]
MTDSTLTSPTAKGLAMTGSAMIRNSPLAREFWENGKSASCPVIDMHGHFGPMGAIWFPWNGVEGMIRAMDRAGVRLICLCPHNALLVPDIGNEETFQVAKLYRERIKCYLAINPNYPDAIRRDLKAYEDQKSEDASIVGPLGPVALVGLKFLSDYHGIPFDAKEYIPAWEFANERGLPLLAHTWGTSNLDGPAQVRKLAAKYPHVRLLCGHSLHGAWEQAAAIAKEFPNVYLELTAVLDDRGALEIFLAAGLEDRLLFGTDLPWFDPLHGIGTILSTDMSDDQRHKILHRNAEKLLGL